MSNNNYLSPGALVPSKREGFPAGPVTIADLCDVPRWIAWRATPDEDDPAKIRKCPFDPNQPPVEERLARTSEPATWSDRAQAEACARALPPVPGMPHGKRGVSLVLGDHFGVAIGGIDLDDCFTGDNGTRQLAPWARDVMEEFESYSEISPSGTGIKIFFLYDPDIGPAVQEMLRRRKHISGDPGIINGTQWRWAKLHDTDHAPAIEFYITGQQFTVTGEHWESSPAELCSVGLDSIAHLFQMIGPTFQREAPPERRVTAGGRDNTPSGVTFRFVKKERAAGRMTSQEQALALLMANNEVPGDWIRGKNARARVRHIRYIWNKTAPEQKALQGVPPPLTPDTRPTVQVQASEINGAIDKAEAHLIEAQPNLYVRGGMIVHITDEQAKLSGGTLHDTLVIRQVGPAHVREVMDSVVRFEHWDKRAAGGGAYVAIDCPKEVAARYADRNIWRLPKLLAVTDAPTLRADGSLITQRGYDADTGIALINGRTKFPDIPERPTKDEARKALEKIDNTLFCKYKFATPADHSVALSSVLTAVVRLAIPVAPIHGFDSPAAGSGKSKFLKVSCLLAMGHLPVEITAGVDDEELAKKLTGEIKAGRRVIAIDNVTRPIGGDLLAHLATEPLVAPRLMMTNDNLAVPNIFFVEISGNNLTLIGDVAARRALRCRVNPGVARPDLLSYDFDPVARAREQRPELLAAALTVLRGFRLTGENVRLKNPLGSFEEWSGWVRGALVWLDKDDPCDTVELVRAEDPVLANLTAVMEAWLRVLRADMEVTTHEAVRQATLPSVGGWKNPDLREALRAVAPDDRDHVSSKKLGWYLRHHVERIVEIGGESYRFMRGNAERDWKLEHVMRQGDLRRQGERSFGDK